MKGSDIQRTIIDLLIWDGYLVIRPNGGAMATEDGRYIPFIRWSAVGYGENIQKGVSDIIAFRACLPSLAIEVKGSGDTLKPEQAAFLEAWEKAGGVSIVATAADDIMPYLVRTIG